MPDLSYFSFEEVWSPFYFFFIALAAIGYMYLTGPWREKHRPDEPKPSGWKQLGALTAFLFYYLAQGGPLELLGHLNFTFHMVNMALSYLIVPPLFLLCAPAFIWRLLFAAPFWRKLRWLMHPLISLVLFNGLFSLYHVPRVHDFIMTNYTVHTIYYFVLLITSFMMWWQIVSPVPEWPRLADVRKMGYIFANGVLLTPACALIIFAPAPIYSIYSDPQIWADAMGYCVADPMALLAMVGGPEAFTMMDPLEDQQAGGIIMKLIQEVMYGCILAVVFTQWFRREHKDDEMPPRLEPGTGGNNA